MPKASPDDGIILVDFIRVLNNTNMVGAVVFFINLQVKSDDYPHGSDFSLFFYHLYIYIYIRIYENAHINLFLSLCLCVWHFVLSEDFSATRCILKTLYTFSHNDRCCAYIIILFVIAIERDWWRTECRLFSKWSLPSLGVHRFCKIGFTTSLYIRPEVQASRNYFIKQFSGNSK